MSRILILEDEPFIAMDLAFAVEDAGHIPVTAVNNAEALEAIAAGAISAAILDVSLGRSENCEPTASALSNRKIPFLLHTGDLNRVGEMLRDLGAQIIAKPAPSEDVVARVVDLIAKAA